MAIEFNLLSGATIDNQLRLLYELLSGGDSYLGFGRSHETWGQGTLIRYKPAQVKFGLMTSLVKPSAQKFTMIYIV